MSKSRPDNGNGNNDKNNHEIASKPDTLNLIELKKKDINSLIKIAREYNIENANSMRGQELLFALLQAQTRRKGIIYGCLLYTSPSPRDKRQSRMPSSA